MNQSEPPRSLQCSRAHGRNEMSLSAKLRINSAKHHVILAAIFLVVTAKADAAVPRRSVSDEQIVAQGQLVASGTHVEIYQHGAVIDRSFLNVMESAYEQVRSVTGLELDTATLGPKVRVYVSDAIGVSHVWRGYQHPKDPKAIIFLNLRVYQGAMSGKKAVGVVAVYRGARSDSVKNAFDVGAVYLRAAWSRLTGPLEPIIRLLRNDSIFRNVSAA